MELLHDVGASLGVGPHRYRVLGPHLMRGFTLIDIEAASAGVTRTE
ncbi:hypothetical protein [Streptomyces sp900116325]